MNTIQRQSISQNLTNMLAETAGFSDIYRQDYSGCFRDIKDDINLKGEKYRQQDNSPINNFRFLHIIYTSYTVPHPVTHNFDLCSLFKNTHPPIS